MINIKYVIYNIIKEYVIEGVFEQIFEFFQKKF